MPPGILANALKEFDLAIDDIASAIEFVAAANRLRPRLGGMLGWQSMDNDAKQLAKEFLGQRYAEPSLLYRGMLVSLSGAFEQFVRRVVHDSILAINARGMKYADLDDTLKAENFHRTGQAFQTIHEPLDYLDLNHEELAQNVGTCCKASAKAVLNAEAFTLFISIVSPDNLAKALTRIGVHLDWDTLGKAPEVRDALAKNKTRETAKEVQAVLRSFGQTRNKIAHTGSSGVTVSESDMQQLLAFFRSFSRALAGAVEPEVDKRSKL
jgi:hypothetical protein